MRAPVSVERLSLMALANWESPSTSRALRNRGCTFFVVPVFDSRRPKLLSFHSPFNWRAFSAEVKILFCGIGIIRMRFSIRPGSGASFKDFVRLGLPLGHLFKISFGY